MASRQQYVSLARSLHPRLTRFFARYPPAVTQQTLIESSSPLPLDDPPVNIAPEAPSDRPTPTTLPDVAPASFNPFQSHKHPASGQWHRPIFSLRRQAELVKLAHEYGVEELLPYTVKGTQERLRRREENGLRVKGTGVAQKVKGKEWERTMKGRLEKRRQAMLEMPQMIQTWKERGHGRGWKKWPK